MISRRMTTVLAAGVLPLALAACGSGRSPHTYEQRPTVDAAEASMGDLQLRNVTIQPPRAGQETFEVGGEATATLSVVNMGEAPDRLVSVTTDVATTVELLAADKVIVPRVDIPPLGAVGSSDCSILLGGLTRALRPGQHVEMTFEFTRSGRRELLVPVGTYLSPVPRPDHDIFHIEEGGGGAEDGGGGHESGGAEHSSDGGGEGGAQTGGEETGAEGLSEG